MLIILLRSTFCLYCRQKPQSLPLTLCSCRIENNIFLFVVCSPCTVVCLLLSRFKIFYCTVPPECVAWASIRHLQLKVEVVSAAQRDSIGEKASWEKARHSAAAKGLVADTDSPCLVAFMAGNKVIQQESSAGICHRTRTTTNTVPCSKTCYSSGVFIRNETAQGGSFVQKTFLIKTHKEKL